MAKAVLFISKKFAKNACVKPKNNMIRIKRERNPIVKSEKDIDETPFDSSTVYCGSKDVTEVQRKQIESLTNEKQKLIEDLMATKDENQKMYFEIQSSQQKISTLQNDIKMAKEELARHQQSNSQLNREKNALQARIKQLLASVSSNDSQTNNNIVESEDQLFEVESILDHKVENGVRRFLIRWENYSPSHDSWEREENLECPGILNAYFSSIKKK